jgi:hypothetical protein
MRTVATEARLEYHRLREQRGGELETLTKAWALRELEALPRGMVHDWIQMGQPPAAMQLLIEGLPEPVAELVVEHVGDELGECEICRRRGPCRLQSDRSESGESDWICAWGCPPRSDDPTERATLAEWAREVGL